MKLNEKEVKTCLLYALRTFFKDNEIIINDSSLFINEKIYVKANLSYQNHIFDCIGEMKLEYKNHSLYVKELQGHVEYLFLKLSLMKLLEQLITSDNIHVYEDSLVYDCDLPISYIDIREHEIEIMLKEES